MKNNESKMQLLEEKTKSIQEIKISNFVLKTTSLLELTTGASIIAISLKHETHPAIQIISGVVTLAGVFGLAYSSIIDTDTNADIEKINDDLEETEKENSKSESTLAKIKRMQYRIND